MAAMLALLATPAAALEPPRPDQRAFLTQAIAADGLLWLLDDAGRLSSLDPRSGAVLPQAIDARVAGLCSRDGHARLLTYPPPSGGSSFKLLRHSDGRWIDEAVVDGRGGVFLALACTADGALVLTTRHLIEIGTDGERALTLSGMPPLASVTALHADADALFFGFNEGEWGGGLYRIDRRSGATTRLLAANVNGVVADLEHPGCLLVAVGLVHFEPSGRLAGLCPKDVETEGRTIFTKPFGEKVGGRPPVGTMAFFGLALTRQGVVAAGLDGLYTLRRDLPPSFRAMPKLRGYGPFRASFSVPGLAVLLTRVQQRKSVGGPTPLLVPLR